MSSYSKQLRHSVEQQISFQSNYSIDLEEKPNLCGLKGTFGDVKNTKNVGFYGSFFRYFIFY